MILDDAAITRFRQCYRIEFGAAGTDDPLYEAISAGRKHQGVEHWLAFFHDRLETLFDYMPSSVITLDDQITPMRFARWDAILDQYETRRLAMNNRSKMDSVYKPAPPTGLYLNDAEWEAVLKNRRVLQLVTLPQSIGLGVTDAGGRIGRNFSPERQREDVFTF